MLDEHSKPRLKEGVSVVNPEGVDVLFAFRSSTGERFELNDVSCEIIRRLDGSTTLSAIVSQIEAEFDGAENVSEDVLEFVMCLVEEDLVTLGP